MHPEKGQFKINAQRLKSYFGGEFHAGRQDTILSTLGEESKGVEGHQQLSYFSGLSVVRCRNVKLTMLNIALF